MLSLYGVHIGLRAMRKHLAWYVERSGLDGAAQRQWRARFCQADDWRVVDRDIGAFFEALEVMAEADPPMSAPMSAPISAPMSAPKHAEMAAPVNAPKSKTTRLGRPRAAGPVSSEARP